MKMDFTKEDLKTIFNEAKGYGKKYVGVIFELPKHPGRELIINSKENFDCKEEYYMNTYDDDLINYRNQGVRIVRAFHFNKFSELESIDLSFNTQMICK